MAISHLYPTQRPSLDLNFARQKRLDSRVTFTRGSTATYVGSDGLIKTAASGEARFDHNPETGESLGLLMEEARTNLETYSEVFTDSSWVKSYISVNPNAIVSPDGLSNGTKLVETTNNAAHGVYQELSILTSGVKYTHTVFAKAGERSTLQLSSNQGSDYANFDLLNGTITYSTAGSNASIVALPNGWYKCSSQFTPSSVALVRPLILFYNTSNPTRIGSYVGDGTSGIYIWGAQLEAGSFPTSYIPTSGSTATRAADVASITGSNFSSWYNSSQGTTFFATRLQTPAPSFSHGFLSEEAGNQFRCGIYSESWIAWRPGDYIGPGSPVISGLNKGAFCYDRTNSTQSRCFNGTTPTNATYSIPSSPSSVPVAFRVGSVQIARLTYYPTRLSDTQLQALTL